MGDRTHRISAAVSILDHADEVALNGALAGFDVARGVRDAVAQVEYLHLCSGTF